MKADQAGGQTALGAMERPAAHNGPWLGAREARMDAEPLFEQTEAEAGSESLALSASSEASSGWMKKAGVIFGVSLIFISGLGAGAMVGWTRGEAAGRAYQKAEQGEHGPWGAGPKPLAASPVSALGAVAPMGAPRLPIQAEPEPATESSGAKRAAEASVKPAPSRPKAIRASKRERSRGQEQSDDLERGLGGALAPEWVEPSPPESEVSGRPDDIQAREALTQREAEERRLERQLERQRQRRLELERRYERDFPAR